MTYTVGWSPWFMLALAALIYLTPLLARRSRRDSGTLNRGAVTGTARTRGSESLQDRRVSTRCPTRSCRFRPLPRAARRSPVWNGRGR